MKTELVVARYRENLNWLRNTPREIEKIVYDKSGEPFSLSSPDEFRHVALPNIGREAHSYLHHIVENYDSLADITVFAQGKPFDHAFDFHQTLRQIAREGFSQDFRWLGHIIDTDTHDGSRLFATWSKNQGHERLDLDGFHRALFGCDGPTEYTFVLGGQFVVSKTKLLSRPLDFWRNALHVAQSFPDAAHCYERSWDKVFATVGISPQFLAGRKTVYLKPIREKSHN